MRKKINVLVMSAIGSDCLRLISDASPLVNIIDVSGLFRDELKGDIVARDKLSDLLAGAEVIFGLRLPQGVLSRSPDLKWIQVMSAGVEHFLDADMLDSQVKLTNVSGIHATPMGEFVIGLMLMFVKKSPVCLDLKQRKKWERLSPGVLNSKTVGIIGLGSIGKEVARLSKAFNMKIIATSRSARENTRARNVDIMVPSHQLDSLLQESDFVVLTVPFTSETRKMIGEPELKQMKSTAYLINIARGGIIDEPALIKALEQRWIAGAGLDVFSVEPLPLDSPLWKMPEVIISPHIAGIRPDYALAATGLFIDNLRRYLNGVRLKNIVDKKRGY
jgi:phosphoglycerate dehydrogenase-like enzyme